VESQRQVVRPEKQRIEHSEAVSVRYQAHVLLINRDVSQDVGFDMKALWPRERVREELTIAELELHETRIDKLDVEGLLGFAE
jgi:hypothetical protein